MKEDVRHRVLEEASKLFINGGIKHITMDEIAETLGMSKRTLYEEFKDKNTLVLECLNDLAKKNLVYFKEIVDKSENIIETLARLQKKSEEITQKVNPKFFEDVRGIPNLDCLNNGVKEQIGSWIALSCEKGKLNGLIRDELDSTLVAKILLEGMPRIYDLHLKKDTGLTKNEILHQVSSIVYRGIVTEKGLAYMEGIEEKLNKGE